jgi:hypothetical protein
MKKLMNLLQSHYFGVDKIKTLKMKQEVVQCSSVACVVMTFGI